MTHLRCIEPATALCLYSYNAFCNSLQRFDFKGTLGPEGMLASDWLLPCVKFCAKPPSVFEEVGLSLFLAQKTDIFEICCEIL